MNFKTLPLLSIIFLFSFIPNKVIKFNANWQIGEVKTYQIKQKVIDLKDGQINKVIQYQYDTKVKVLDFKEGTYTISWDFKDQQLINEMGKNVRPESIDNLANITIKYKTDIQGKFKEIINYNDIKLKLDIFFNKVLAEPLVAQNPEQQKIIKEYQKFITTNEGINAFYTKDIKVFHHFYGTVLDVKNPTKSKTTLPNYWAEEPLSATSTITTKAVDNSNKTCQFENDIAIEPNTLKELSKKILIKMVDPTNQMTKIQQDEALNNMSEITNSLKVELGENNSAEVNYSKGWPIKLYFKRSSNIQLKDKKEKRMDIVEINEI